MHKGLLHKYAGLFGLAPTDEDVRIGIQARCSILEGATSCGRKSLRTLRGLSKNVSVAEYELMQKILGLVKVADESKGLIAFGRVWEG